MCHLQKVPFGKSEENSKMNLPEDPFMLMSVINQQLRDIYPTLDKLCKSLDIDRSYLEEKLKKAGFEYNPAANKFW